MEFNRLSVLALICLALVGSDATQSGEDYWHSVWPNTPLPKTLSDLLMPYSEIPINAEEDKQYWTVFFEHDLYPGKQMSLGVHKQSNIHHQHFQPKITKEVSQPFGVHGWDTTEKVAQPFGVRAWDTAEKVAQPFGVRAWDTAEKVAQPFGVRAWDKAEKVAQPFGVRAWDTAEKVVQPFGVRAWDKAEKVAQPFGVRAWDTTERVAQPFGVRAWDTAERVAQPEKENIDDYCRTPSAVGEEKYCIDSLKSMMDFAISKLGTNIKVISSSFTQNHDEYVVKEVKKIGDKAVMCHRLNFEKAVFYCHQVNATTAYMVPLVTSDGIKVDALTICHHDTRGMSPDVLYDVLKVKPGTIPVCHFVGNKAVAWVPNRDASSESIDHPCVI